jgi:hypothetical protein
VQWTANGVAVCTASNFQILGSISSDGASGAIIAWHDKRNGAPNSDIYCQRISAEGVVQWAANGVAICISPNNQEWAVIISDGTNGAIIAWYDRRSGTNQDIYAQRINGSGAVLWTVNGAEISTVSGNQESPAIVGDGSGGAIITWRDYRSGTEYDIYAQRVFSNGAAQWTSDGIVISKVAGDKEYAALVSDPAGGAIFTWSDKRNGSSNADIYVQRVNADGSLDATTSVAEKLTVDGFSLDQNYPNPFNQSTTIRYNLPHSSFVILTIYNTFGQQVLQLVNQQQQAGSYEVLVDGKQLPPGTYLYRLNAGDFKATKKMTILP